jgi:hypothetical protein
MQAVHAFLYRQELSTLRSPMRVRGTHDGRATKQRVIESRSVFWEVA